MQVLSQAFEPANGISNNDLFGCILQIHVKTYQQEKRHIYEVANTNECTAKMFPYSYAFRTR